jgi:hypothetical protein
VYDGNDTGIEDHDGEICITPGTEIANFKLGDVTVADVDNDGDLEYTFDVTFDGVTSVYINMHLDFSLEKQTGWVKSGENALDNPNAPGVQPTLLEGQEFEFSADVNGSLLAGSEDSIYNDNVFKTIKGIGGLFQSDESETVGLDEIAVQGQHLIIKDTKGAGTLMGDAYTDADGWYYAQFMATGKQAEYKVYWDQNNNNTIDVGEVSKTVLMGGAAGKWADADFTVVDPVGYHPSPPVPDYIIDSYGSWA